MTSSRLPDAEPPAHVISDEVHQGVRFTFRVEVVSGEEGEQLALAQARALRQLLLWVRQNRPERRGDQYQNPRANEH